jgi:hypothetical protein
VGQPRAQEMPSCPEIEPGYDVPGDLHGSDAVFGLIGAPTSARDARSRQSHSLDCLREHEAYEAFSPGGTDESQDETLDAHRDVMQALHEQYWRALDDPHASLADEWAGQSAAGSVLKGVPSVESPDARQEQHAGPADTGSIETILLGARVLEDVFGPLRKGEVPEPEVEPVPEILRLFAPPEYRAAAARRMPALAPALARREHHALSIDSPVPVPASSGRTGVIASGRKTWATSAGDLRLFELGACKFGVHGVANGPAAARRQQDCADDEA